jgi:hypothetical protein
MPETRWTGPRSTGDALLLLVPLMTTMIAMPAVDARGTTYIVAPDGMGDQPTIQAAIDAARDGDVVELLDGALAGPGNRDIDYGGKEITVRSRSGNATACVIDCQDRGRGFFFRTGEGPGARLEHVTVTRGHASGSDNLERSGGGAHCRLGSSPTFEGCIFAANRADYAGGGIALAHDAAPALVACSLAANTAIFGGGLFAIDLCAPVLAGTLLRDNHGDQHGGALYCYGSTITLDSCTLSGNEAFLGAAIDCHEGSTVTLMRCTVTGNVTGFGGAIRAYTASVEATSTIIAFGSGAAASVSCLGPGAAAMLSCCNVFGNAGGDWIGCIEDQLGVRDNMSVDPDFCSNAPDEDGYWVLQVDSPCAPGVSACGPIGAWEIGCSSSPVRSRTWGEVKASYR